MDLLKYDVTKVFTTSTVTSVVSHSYTWTEHTTQIITVTNESTAGADASVEASYNVAS